MPFGSPFDGYYEHVIKPAVESSGLRAQRADEIYGTNPIIQDIWKSIWKARIVIADVSKRNPNVNYELGLCHALGLPTILITRTIEDVPFDYRHRRCVIYNTDEAGWEERLKQNIRKTIGAVISTPTAADGRGDLPWPYEASPLPKQLGLSGSVIVEDPRVIILKGVAAVEAAAAKAYGPRGLDSSFSSEHGTTLSVNQGAALASNLTSTNTLQMRGIEMAQAVARQVQADAGDGTKAALLLLHALLAHGHEALDRLGPGHSISEFVIGMDAALKSVVTALNAGAKRATLSNLSGLTEAAARNRQLASAIVKAIDGVGPDGTVTIATGKAGEPRVDFLEGMRLSSGYVHEDFVNSPQTRECVLLEPKVLIYDGKISGIREIVPILELVAKEGCPLFVIAREVEGEALATLVVNAINATVTSAAIRAGVGAQRLPALLQDLAVVTGGKALSADVGVMLAAVRATDLGSAEKIVVGKADTTILGGRGRPEAIRAHVQGLRSELNSSTNPLERDRLQERITNLAGRIATITVGGPTQPEMEDQFYRARSALSTAFAAISEGWVCGGGVALLQARQSISTVGLTSVAAESGSDVVFRSLERPFAALVQSAGGDPVTVLAALHDSGLTNGFNVNTGAVEDLLVAGVLDAVSVVRTCVEVAGSYAKSVLRTGSWNIVEPRRIHPIRESSD